MQLGLKDFKRFEKQIVLKNVGVAGQKKIFNAKILINLSNETFVVERGTRIAQMVLCPIIKAKFKEVDSLDDTDRGASGFGSTGLK